jgi:hypothetical protein
MACVQNVSLSPSEKQRPDRRVKKFLKFLSLPLATRKRSRLRNSRGMSGDQELLKKNEIIWKWKEV